MVVPHKGKLSIFLRYYKIQKFVISTFLRILSFVHNIDFRLIFRIMRYRSMAISHNSKDGTSRSFFAFVLKIKVDKRVIGSLHQIDDGEIEGNCNEDVSSSEVQGRTNQALLLDLPFQKGGKREGEEAGACKKQSIFPQVKQSGCKGEA